MAELDASCRKRGMKLGVYLSPADDKLGALSGGRCKTPEEQRRYDKIYRQQLTELLSRYGEISEVWFDGSLFIEVGDFLKKYAPKAMVFQGSHATIRWVGNEAGFAPYPAWNSVDKADAKTGVATARHGTPDGDVWQPLEVDTAFHQKLYHNFWFWNSNESDRHRKSLNKLMKIYYDSVGHGAVLLLGHAPDTTSAICEADVKRAAEFGAEIRRRFGASLAETSGEGETVELDLKATAVIDHVIIMEDIVHGERVRKYTIGDVSQRPRAHATSRRRRIARRPGLLRRGQYGKARLRHL